MLCSTAANLQTIREARTRSRSPIVQQRRPYFQAVRHARAIDFRQNGSRKDRSQNRTRERRSVTRRIAVDHRWRRTKTESDGINKRPAKSGRSAGGHPALLPVIGSSAQLQHEPLELPVQALIRMTRRQRPHERRNDAHREEFGQRPKTCEQNDAPCTSDIRPRIRLRRRHLVQPSHVGRQLRDEIRRQQSMDRPSVRPGRSSIVQVMSRSRSDNRISK